MSLQRAYTRVDRGNPDRKGNDYYPTAPVATYALIKYLGSKGAGIPSGPIWEPAAGRGWISKELERLGAEVYSSDLYAYPNSFVQVKTGVDFLTTEDVPDVRSIVTNPPYKNDLAERFTLRALDVKGVQTVAMYCRLTFMEGIGRHSRLWTKDPPALVLAMNQRTNADESYFPDKQLGGMVAYAWYVWDPLIMQQNDGKTILDWLDMTKAYEDWKRETEIDARTA